jgi:signal transduction histidine kinase
VFNVGDLMLRLAGQFESQAQAKGLGFSVDIPDFTVQSDEALLSQILSNFLGNAIRYTDAGKIINLGLS